MPGSVLERVSAYLQQKRDEFENRQLSALYDFCAEKVGRRVQFKINGIVQITLRHDANDGIVFEGEKLDLRTTGTIEIICLESNGTIARTEQGDYRRYQALLSKIE
ncbi:MAG TPA: hypothetical protein VJ246_02890 [Patescibacteria group bacterium]|nr:hypothetical protein [Patescibacteria group bacterium]